MHRVFQSRKITTVGPSVREEFPISGADERRARERIRNAILGVIQRCRQIALDRCTNCLRCSSSPQRWIACTNADLLPNERTPFLCTHSGKAGGTKGPIVSRNFAFATCNCFKKILKRKLASLLVALKSTLPSPVEIFWCAER